MSDEDRTHIGTMNDFVLHPPPGKMQGRLVYGGPVVKFDWIKDYYGYIRIVAVRVSSRDDVKRLSGYQATVWTSGAEIEEFRAKQGEDFALEEQADEERP